MAMMCDLLVAAESAKFSDPQGKVGITGGMIAGLANRVVPDGTELHEAIAIANKIVDLATLTFATMKRFVTEHIERPFRAGGSLQRRALGRA